MASVQTDIHDVQRMSPECMKMLMETLFQPSSLESLRMWGVDVSSALESLALLADNTNLTSMKISHIRPALSSMLEVLKDNKSVKSLKIQCLNADDVGAVASVLTANKYLDTLKIYPITSIREKGRLRCKALCLAVINILQHNKSLKKLKFSSRSSVGSLFTQAEKDAMDPRVVLTPTPSFF